MNTMKKCNFCALKDAKPCMECSMCMSGDNHFRPIPKVEKSDSLKRGDPMDILGVIAMVLATVVAWWSAHRKDLCMTVLFCFFASCGLYFNGKVIL